MHDSIDVVPVASSGFRHPSRSRDSRRASPLGVSPARPRVPRATCDYSPWPPRARAGWEIFPRSVVRTPIKPVHSRASADDKIAAHQIRTHGRRPTDRRADRPRPRVSAVSGRARAPSRTLARCPSRRSGPPPSSPRSRLASDWRASRFPREPGVRRSASASSPRTVRAKEPAGCFP